jgi:peptide-methionine (S)-S-oxide reductase
MTSVFNARKILVALPLAAMAAFAVYNGPVSFSAINPAFAAEGIRIPAPKLAIAETGKTQVAVFSGGCFWGIEGVFDHVKGVSRAESGYAGGSRASASYDTVSGGTTGHAESVRVTYDPSVVSYAELLHIFFSVGLDPTELNRQGPDNGTQYRSALWPTNADQVKVARAYIAQLSAKSPWGKMPVTKLESGTFYPAETYHQNFLKNNPNHPYIRSWDLPKVANLKRLFPARYR